MLDFKKFDIIMITGYKGRSISLEKIVRTSIEQLKSQAGGKFDPSMTVIRAKALRNSNKKEELIQIHTNLEAPKEQEADVLIEKEEETSELQPTINEFKLPDNTAKLNTLISIVQSHPGDISVKIGHKQFLINETGLAQLHTLLD